MMCYGFVDWRYIVLKEVYLIKDKNTIDILGVFHGSLAIEKYLKY